MYGRAAQYFQGIPDPQTIKVLLVLQTVKVLLVPQLGSAQRLALGAVGVGITSSSPEFLIKINTKWKIFKRKKKTIKL